MIIMISTGACGPVQLASLPNLRGLNTLKTSPCCRREEAHPACKKPSWRLSVLRASLAVASFTKKKTWSGEIGVRIPSVAGEMDL